MKSKLRDRLSMEYIFYNKQNFEMPFFDKKKYIYNLNNVKKKFFLSYLKN